MKIIKVTYEQLDIYVNWILVIRRRDDKMIRLERIKHTIDFIEKYKNSKSILKVNYENVNEIIKELNDKNKEIFISADKTDWNIDELKECKKLYSNALKRLKKEVK